MVTVPKQTEDVTPVPVSTELAAEDVTKAYGAAVGETLTEPELEAVKEATTMFLCICMRLCTCVRFFMCIHHVLWMIHYTPPHHE